MTMTPPSGAIKSHELDESCCPDGHWWLEDTEKAAAMAREIIESYGWKMTEATWESPDWHIRAISPHGQIDARSEHLGACFMHLTETLRDYGWFDEKYKVKK